MSSQEMDSLVRILRECSKGRPPPIYKPLLKTSRWTVMVGCVLGSMEKSMTTKKTPTKGIVMKIQWSRLNLI
jgi:hypothetical protein